MFPIAPSPPQYLHVISETANSITIEWLPPAEPNGQISEYIIKYSSNNISWDSISKRDYCQNSMLFSSLKLYIINNFVHILHIFSLGVDIKSQPESYVGTKKEMVFSGNNKKENCNCTTQPEKKQSKIKNEQQIQTMIEFENNLQNIVFVKTYVKQIFINV